MNLEWKEHYTMGIEQIDEDHQKLFKIAGKIIQTVESTNGTDKGARLFVVREGVKYLKNYFDEHAVREEAYMRKIGYKDLDAHKRLHDEFKNVQLAEFEEIIERGACTRDEVFKFVGLGIGWLLEHISTADMAIVGKGVLCVPKAPQLNRAVLEQEVNMMFAATLNMEVNARIIDTDYRGSDFGDAVCQRLTYRREGEILTVIAGIEKSFLVKVAQMVYGDAIDDADALVFATLEIFGATFWRTLGERLLRSGKTVEYLENHFLTRNQVRTAISERRPEISVLFDSEWGKFFAASQDPTWNNAQMAAG